MDEKKLEKLIVAGFKAQEKKLDAFKKSIESDMVTQGDLDSRLQDQADLFLGEIEKLREDDIKELKEADSEMLVLLKAINKRTHEETTDLYRKVDVLEHRFEYFMVGK